MNKQVLIRVVQGGILEFAPFVMIGRFVPKTVCIPIWPSNKVIIIQILPSIHSQPYGIDQSTMVVAD